MAAHMHVVNRPNLHRARGERSAPTIDLISHHFIMPAPPTLLLLLLAAAAVSPALGAWQQHTGRSTVMPPLRPPLRATPAIVASAAADTDDDDGPSSFWQGKRVLLTGASSGLGAALACELAARGASSLVLAARRADRLTETADACHQRRRAAASSGALEVHTLPLDAAAPAEELARKAAEAEALLGGRCDVLLCASGVGQRTRAVDTPAEAHASIMAANFEGSVALSRALVPGMVARRSGHVGVVSSVQGFFGQPYRSSYAASKAAVHGYFDALRAELADEGVGVTVVCPGYIATEHAASAVGGDGRPDENTSKGVAPEALAAQIADAVAGGVPELVAAPLDARAAIWLRALFPSGLFAYMRRKARKGAS